MKTIRIKIGREGFCEKVLAVQGDSGRVLKCVIEDWEIPEGSVARIYALKPSRFKVYNDCVIEGNEVIVKLTTQMLAEIGNVNCQVEITKLDAAVTTFEFVIEVRRQLKDSPAIESGNEYTALENALKKVEDMEYPAFDEAKIRENINSGDRAQVILGKIKKWFSDLKSAAFCSVVNGLTEENEGGVLDARQGKVLGDRINVLNSNLSYEKFQVLPGGESVTIFRQNCYKVGKMIHIEFEASCAVNMPNSSIWAEIPVKYCPSKQINNIGIYSSLGVTYGRCAVLGIYSYLNKYGGILQRLQSIVSANTTISMSLDYYLE